MTIAKNAQNRIYILQKFSGVTPPDNHFVLLTMIRHSYHTPNYSPDNPNHTT